MSGSNGQRPIKKSTEWGQPNKMEIARRADVVGPPRPAELPSRASEQLLRLWINVFDIKKGIRNHSLTPQVLEGMFFRSRFLLLAPCFLLSIIFFVAKFLIRPHELAVPIKRGNPQPSFFIHYGFTLLAPCSLLPAPRYRLCAASRCRFYCRF